VSQCPDVGRVVVLYHQLSDVSSVIVAYYTLATSATDHNVEAACQTSLPVYMRPKLVLVDKIPLLPHSGKVDRKALHRVYVDHFNRQTCSQLTTLNEAKMKVTLT